jgi:hypothetical protein
VRYASWARRVAGRLVDTVLGALALLPGYVLVLLGDTTTTTTVDRDHFSSMKMNPDGTTTPIPLRVTTTHYDAMTIAGFVLVVLGALAFFVWNDCVRQGRTGCTVGKQVVGIRLVGVRTGSPVGAGPSFLRQLAHLLDSLPCYLGWLWPLWDPRCQTFADKVMDTVVVVERKDAPAQA